ncbi:class I SAM-dependent methyltransferase [Conexibacter woesei]|uniref:Methyltransferase type 12 n=1 Tax=Conexibacter woesei (strain DSM 14684 / CCUG 47730 / CIP 108061 / JCM 11494 / NBRC 100937 / ID131577) TaxID=469383 RepID=D3EZR9_CONWI|nr:class I SAM-dependent methyltransferase [Conexibacter woesei]ADB53907.1 Methyltransferase type 12 [Conexibacter woesei DSM 14684]
MTTDDGPIAKQTTYYENSRPEIVAALPRPLGAVLDVGCGAGNVGASVRDAGATRVVGVEYVPEQAERARSLLDRVITGPVEAAFGELADERFDTILCLDVLEHLVDPEAVLRNLRELAAPGAHIQISVPNARHVSLAWDLLVRGTFGYTEHGHRDNTHLRWFTRSDIVAAAERAGWKVQRVSHPPLTRTRQLDRLTRGRSTEFTVGQWYVLAQRSVG